VVKAWSGATGRLLDLRQVGVVVDPAGQAFSARVAGTPGSTLEVEGRFAWGDGLVLTAVWLAAR
jgi:hypothetical protein